MKPLVVTLCLLGAGYAASAQYMDTGTSGGGKAVTERDDRLVGKWVAIFSLSATGEVHREGFEIEYLPNGKAGFNRQALYVKFNQQLTRQGKAPLSTAQLERYFPRVTWKTTGDHVVLTFKSRLGTNDLAYRYSIHGDTLTTVNEALSGTQSKLVAIRRGE